MLNELVDTFKKRALEGGFNESRVDSILHFALEYTFKDITTRLDQVPKHYEGIRKALIEYGIECGLDETEAEKMAEHFFNNKYVKEDLEEGMTGYVATMCDVSRYYVFDWIRVRIESYTRNYVKGREERAIEIAKMMIRHGDSVEFISSITGLSADLIEELKDQENKN